MNPMYEDYKELAGEVNQLRQDFTVAVSSLNILIEQNAGGVSATREELKEFAKDLSGKFNDLDKKLLLLTERFDTLKKAAESDTQKVRTLELDKVSGEADIKRTATRYQIIGVIAVASITALASLVTTIINVFFKDGR